jgi:flagellin-like protein
LGAIGVTEVESRALVPVEGVLILIVVVFAYHSVIGKSRRIQFAAAMACLFCLVFYAAGQYGVLREVAIDRREMGSDGNYCHAPKTIAWATENIPPRSVVIAPQCGYQLLADTPQFYWLPIPPADEYRGSEAYNETWGESDFVRISGNTGAKWIVLLRGYRGDPLEDQPGYGAYVTSMFMGEIKSNMIRRVANFPDGSVYSIVGNTSP